MSGTKRTVEMKVDVMFIFRHRIESCLEDRQRTDRSEKLVHLWSKLYQLEDDYLNGKLEDFAEKIGTTTLGVWELDYVAQKVLDELLSK